MKTNAVIKRDQVRLTAAPGCDGTAATLRTEVVDGVIQRLVVRCPCGHETPIDCVYDAGPAGRPGTAPGKAAR